MIHRLLIIWLFLISAGCSAETRVIPGAERTDAYLPLIGGSTVGIVANPTSMIQGTHLVDSLYSLGTEVLRVWRVFSPEHGFRGEAEYGEQVEDGVDAQTGLPVSSLYGKNRKPTPEDLEDLDMVIFDIQDVGVRFFTYISTLFYVMQSCAENDKELILLDRPNPNGFYVDGPMLDTLYSSFIGVNEIPVVYGMTMGEYGRMINGEGWLGDGLKCRLTVIPCLHYDHNTLYELPVKPSPNLPNMNSIYLYPSTCFFEGTVISEGRGTDFPFEAFGHPDLGKGSFSYIPESKPGASMHPKLKGETCFGMDLRTLRNIPPHEKKFSLAWLLFAYRNFPDKENFFIPYFELLAGTGDLRKQIMEGAEEEQIRETWAAGLAAFKRIRQKYLLYPDFE